MSACINGSGSHYGAALLINPAAHLTDRAMPLEIAVLLLPRFSLMALSAVLEPFRIANRLAGRELYHWRFVSPEAGRVEASSGLPLTL